MTADTITVSGAMAAVHLHTANDGRVWASVQTTGTAAGDDLILFPNAYDRLRDHLVEGVPFTAVAVKDDTTSGKILALTIGDQSFDGGPLGARLETTSPQAIEAAQQWWASHKEAQAPR